MAAVSLLWDTNMAAVTSCENTLLAIRELKQRQRRRQRQRQKRNRFRLVNNNSARASCFFCTFLCHHCTTTTWKRLISRFVENVNTRQQLYFAFPELRYSLLEFNSRKKCQHLTNWRRWNKRDKDWSNATSLFKWRAECFHMTSRRPCWCAKPILWELNSFLMQTLSFVPINLHRCWPREWKRSIRSRGSGCC